MKEGNSFDDFAILLAKPPIISTPQHYHTKLNETRILLINLNTTITELAKSLIYKGVNLYLYDKDKTGLNQKITEEDVNSNYYLTKEDIGKERIKIVFEKLALISISISISILDDLNNINLVKGIAMACVGFSSFNSMIYYEEYFTRKDIVYYCINNSGIFGFYYNNMINTKKVKKENKYMTRVQSKYLISFNTAESLNDISSTQKISDASKVISEKIRNRSTSPIAKGPLNNDNNRIRQKGNELYYADHIKINPIGFIKKAEEYIGKIKGSSYNSCNYLELIIYLVEMYYRKNVNVCDLKKEFKENNNFQKKIFYIENYLKKNHMKKFIMNETFQQLLK